MAMARLPGVLQREAREVLALRPSLPPRARPAGARRCARSSRAAARRRGRCPGRPRSVKALLRQLGVVAHVREELRVDGPARRREVADLAVERVACPRRRPKTRQSKSCSFSAAPISAAGIERGVVEQVHLARLEVLVGPGARAGADRDEQHLLLAGRPARGCTARGSPSGRAGTPGCCTSSRRRRRRRTTCRLRCRSPRAGRTSARPCLRGRAARAGCRGSGTPGRAGCTSPPGCWRAATASRSSRCA